MMLARSRLLVCAGALAAVSALVAGGGPAVAAPQSAQARQMAPAGQPAGHGHGYGRFTHPLAVDNRFFPLTVGTEFIYHGKIVENGETKPHSVTFTVTDNVTFLTSSPATASLNVSPGLVPVAQFGNSGPDQAVSLGAADLVQLVATITDKDGDASSANLNLGSLPKGHYTVVLNGNQIGQVDV